VAYVRRKFQVAAEQLEQGKALPTALSKAGILKESELRRIDPNSFLASSGDLGNRDIRWGLRQLADARIEKMLNRYSIWSQVTIVVLTLFFAFVIGTVVIGIMWALTYMISSLA
jgi:type II secretory pathway component PulF